MYGRVIRVITMDISIISYQVRSDQRKLAVMERCVMVVLLRNLWEAVAQLNSWKVQWKLDLHILLTVIIHWSWTPVMRTVLRWHITHSSLLVSRTILHMVWEQRRFITVNWLIVSILLLFQDVSLDIILVLMIRLKWMLSTMIMKLVSLTFLWAELIRKIGVWKLLQLLNSCPICHWQLSVRGLMPVIWIILRLFVLMKVKVNLILTAFIVKDFVITEHRCLYIASDWTTAWKVGSLT